MNKSRSPFRLMVVAALLWWAGVAFYFAAVKMPHPLAPHPFVDWHKMALVQDMAPWMMLPFGAAALWGLALWLRKTGSLAPPRWIVWVAGTAALTWIGFVFWRAHGQAFTCAAFGPRDLIWTSTLCSLPHLIGSMAAWLVIPLAAWLLLAAPPLRSRR